MAVTSATSEVSYTGNGVTTAFSFPYLFLSNSDLVVTLTSGDLDDVLTLGVDYTVTGAGVAAGGTVTMTSAPAADETLTIERTVALTQATSFRSAGTFSPKSHEDAIDKAVMMAQQLERRLAVAETDITNIVIDASSVVAEAAVGWLGLNGQEYAAADAVTDDSTALGTAQADASNILHLPEGTYMLGGGGMVLRAPSGTVYRGVGANNTVLKAKSGLTNWLAQASASYPRQNLIFEDLTFDNNDIAVGSVVIYGDYVQGVAFRRCKFLVSSGIGVSLSGAVDVSFEDCEFYGAGKAGTAVAIGSGSRGISFDRCKFIYCTQGISVDTGSSATVDEDLTDWLSVRNCYFHQAWWTWPTTSSNSGGTVTYSATVLTDTAANFSGLTYLQTFRVLESRRTGSLTSTNSVRLTHSGASFVADGVLRGDIVRSGSKFTTVTGIQSATVLRIDGWWDSSTYMPTSPPAAGATYTVYKTITGRVGSSTATAITTYDGFFDMDGTAVTPSAGALYELYRVPGYPLHIEYGGRNVLITGNTFRGGWSDQCSVYCNRAIIANNTVEDGQDVGITLNGTSGDGHSIISGNRVNHNGSCGIFVGAATHTVISGNAVSGCGWTNSVNTYTNGGIMVQNANHCLVSHNYVDGMGLARSSSGIGLETSGQANDSITIVGNVCRRNSRAGIVFSGADNTNIKLRDNRASLYFYSNPGAPPGGDFGVLYHADLGLTGSPESQLVAGPGTIYHASNGVTYVKATGTSTTGWVPLNSTLTSNTTGVGNVGAGEDNLMTYSLPANSLLSTGRGVRITAWGSVANNANAKTLRVYFGGSTLATVSLTAGAAYKWRAEALVFRTGTSAQDYAIEVRETGTGNSAMADGGVTETETSAIVIKCTGQATADNDIVQEGLLVEFV